MSEPQEEEEEENASVALNLHTKEKLCFEHLPDDMVVIFGVMLTLPIEALTNAKTLGMCPILQCSPMFSNG